MPALRAWARRLKRDVLALWLAARDRRTPLGPKLLAAAVAGYALSPIDLIPDFIPVLGYLDDLILVPAGIWLVGKLVPVALMAELREKAARLAQRPVSKVAGAAVLLLWTGMALTLAYFLFRT